MQRMDAAAASLVLSFAMADACAASGTLMVQVRVLPPPSAVTTLDPLPAPVGAMRLTHSRVGDSYSFPGTPVDAARYYRSVMTDLGYRLASESTDGLEQSWRHATRGRVDVQLREVIGDIPTTRIVVMALPTS
jgi:hypothetical protein